MSFDECRGHAGGEAHPLPRRADSGPRGIVLTLVVLPSLYTLVEGARERREARRAARAEAAG